MDKRKRRKNSKLKGTALISTLAAMTILAISTYFTNKAVEVVLIKMKKVNNEASKVFEATTFYDSER